MNSCTSRRREEAVLKLVVLGRGARAQRNPDVQAEMTEDQVEQATLGCLAEVG